MRQATQLWLLLPHAISALCFGAAFAWAFHAGTNRTMPDLYLGIAGFVGLAAALVTTVVAVVLVFRHGVRRSWPWLSIHLGAVCVAFLIADGWMGAHIA